MLAPMEAASLIAGLGNPGRQYAGTRHNAGFLLCEALAHRWSCRWADERKFNARLARAERNGSTVWLCQPLTFMNLSGEAVARVSAFYRVAVARLLIVVDDVDLPLGEIRLRAKGSSGGHHGLENIAAHLGTTDFARLRIGIGRESAAARQVAGYVLAPFSPEEMQRVGLVMERALLQVECWLDEGLEKAMNRYNGRVPNE